MTGTSFKTVLAAAALYGFVVDGGWALFDMKTKTSKAESSAELGEYHGIKHAVGCKQFDNEAGWHGQWEIGDNLSIMLESALFDTGRFVIVEREKLAAVLDEQDLEASGRAAKAKGVAQTGKIRPARYLATGAVTTVEEDQSGGGGGISVKGIRIGGGKSKAQVTIIAKLIDTTTSEVVAKEQIVGKAGRGNLAVGLTVGGVSTDLGGFTKTPLGEAAQDCINQAAVFFAKAMEQIPLDGNVVKVADAGVIINRGSEFGMEVGQMLTMETEGETLTDPETGAILGREEGKKLGELKITKTQEKLSYCEVVSGEANPPPGTRVIFQK